MYKLNTVDGLYYLKYRVKAVKYLMLSILEEVKEQNRESN